MKRIRSTLSFYWEEKKVSIVRLNTNSKTFWLSFVANILWCSKLEEKQKACLKSRARRPRNRFLLILLVVNVSRLPHQQPLGTFPRLVSSDHHLATLQLRGNKDSLLQTGDALCEHTSEAGRYIQRQTLALRKAFKTIFPQCRVLFLKLRQRTKVQSKKIFHHESLSRIDGATTIERAISIVYARQIRRTMLSAIQLL